jgi:hypothetical protein
MDSLDVNHVSYLLNLYTRNTAAQNRQALRFENPPPYVESVDSTPAHNMFGLGMGESSGVCGDNPEDDDTKLPKSAVGGPKNDNKAKEKEVDDKYSQAAAAEKSVSASASAPTTASAQSPPIPRNFAEALALQAVGQLYPPAVTSSSSSSEEEDIPVAESSKTASARHTDSGSRNLHTRRNAKYAEGKGKEPAPRIPPSADEIIPFESTAGSRHQSLVDQGRNSAPETQTLAQHHLKVPAAKRGDGVRCRHTSRRR